MSGDDCTDTDATMIEAAKVIVAKLPYTELAKIVVETYSEDDLSEFVTHCDLLTIDDDELEF